jgi:hypothetical protein
MDLEIESPRPESPYAPWQDTRGRFMAGNIGGGRKPGARPKVAALFWNDLYAVWKAKGMGVMERLADEEPGTFAKIAAMLVGKAEDVVRDDAKDAQVEAYIEERRQKALLMIAKMDGVECQSEQLPVVSAQNEQG